MRPGGRDGAWRREPSCHDEERLRQPQAPDSWSEYIVSACFWNRAPRNRQSEFLVIASLALLSVSLHQRGSPESKPVGAPHAATGVEG